MGRGTERSAKPVNAVLCVVNGLAASARNREWRRIKVALETLIWPMIDLFRPFFPHCRGFTKLLVGPWAMRERYRGQIVTCCICYLQLLFI